MQMIKSLFLLGAIAAPAFAQDSDSCDPQNDSNDDTTCSSSMNMASQTVADSRIDTSVTTSLATVPLVSFSVSTFTSEIVTTDPKSLFTSTTQTRIPYTLYNTRNITSVYTSDVNGMETTGTTTRLPTNSADATAASGNDDNDDNDNNDDSDSSDASSTSSGMGAMATAGKYIPAGALAAALGFAAVL